MTLNSKHYVPPYSQIVIHSFPTTDYDPFNMTQEEELLIQWMQANEEMLVDYDSELESYRSTGVDVPDFVYKSVDKLILEGLELYKTSGIQKPATALTKTLNYIVTNMKFNHPIICMLSDRMNENMKLLEQFRDPKVKELVREKLKERGFV